MFQLFLPKNLYPTFLLFSTEKALYDIVYACSICWLVTVQNDGQN